MRPEDLTVTTSEQSIIEGTISIIEALGEVSLLYAEGLSGKKPLITKLPGNQSLQRGEKIRQTTDPAKLHLFDAEGRTLR